MLAIVLLATTMGLATRPAVAQPAQSGVPGLDLIQSHRTSPRLEELRFRTPALVGETRVRVLLPKGYDRSGRTRYPVLFLLHGGTGGYRDWTDTGDAAAISSPYPMIVVMPDGSGYGNYVDWYNHGAGGPPMWETYHIGQLLPWVDAHYPTVGTRAGRAIAGLSMGGGGAMGYAARHPDLFAAAAAFSGAVDTNSPYVQPLAETSGIQDGHVPGSVMGHRALDEVRWRGHNPWDLAENLRGMYLELHTGNGLPGGPEGLGDPVEFAVHEEMVSFHDRLGELGIPHLWNDYGPGGHGWFYWQRDLRQLLPRLADLFAHPVPAPSRIDHASIAPPGPCSAGRSGCTGPPSSSAGWRGRAETGSPSVGADGPASRPPPPTARERRCRSPCCPRRVAPPPCGGRTTRAVCGWSCPWAPGTPTSSSHRPRWCGRRAER